MRTIRKYRSGQISGILLPLGMICLFAFCSLALALMGSSVYKKIQQDKEDYFGTTVTSNYLRVSLSQNNQDGTISVREQDGHTVLAIQSPQLGTEYETLIFFYQGVLYESFSYKGDPIVLRDCVKIAQLQDFSFSISEGGLFIAEMVSVSGDYARMAFALVKGGGT